MAIKFEDEAPKTTIKFEDDVSAQPLSDKKESGLLEKGTEVGRQGLIGVLLALYFLK